MAEPEKPSIIPAAYLWICPNCARHAVIIDVHGRRSAVFCSKRIGIDFVEEMLEARQLSKEEGMFLRWAIEVSALSEEDPMADAISTVAHRFELEDDLDDEDGKPATIN